MFDECLYLKNWMNQYSGRWWIAGGWAVDLHIGEQTREHKDIEIAIFREDQRLLLPQLSGWEAVYMKDKSPVPWDKEQWLSPPLHEIHAFSGEGMEIEFLLNEKKHDRWKFRRNEKITFPITRMNLQSEQGIPYLNPEIVLLHKAKHTRERDLEDFDNIFVYLNEHQKEWLKQSLMHHHPHHQWLERLLY
ncbi:hypothetical protein LCL89_13640 [Halobacillus yeomjeoni]|uniref:nucleotidyltransferase domain-containing protein n=1 Tax=Halobacillus yeomjeoni TaxID=311194 RepID=UPI001CD7B5DD|nr:hypothetical protein [Halobacillus yeomjeoni]MCA0985081.1 hypothetical protein [Halobacillus yeomjeoni]